MQNLHPSSQTCPVPICISTTPPPPQVRLAVLRIYLKVLKMLMPLEFPGGLVVKIPGFHCHGQGSILGQGTEIPQAMQCGQKAKQNADAPSLTPQMLVRLVQVCPWARGLLKTPQFSKFNPKIQLELAESTEQLRTLGKQVNWSWSCVTQDKPLTLSEPQIPSL